MVWVRSKGEERCWFGRDGVWERNGSGSVGGLGVRGGFGFVGEVWDWVSWVWSGFWVSLGSV